MHVNYYKIWLPGSAKVDSTCLGTMLVPEVRETGHGAHTKYRKIQEPTYDFRKTITYMYSVRNSQKYLLVICQFGQPKSKFSPKKCLVVQSRPQSGLAHLACEVVLMTRGLEATEGLQKLWGKWCKILHSGHILAHKSRLQIVGFF